MQRHARVGAIEFVHRLGKETIRRSGEREKGGKCYQTARLQVQPQNLSEPSVPTQSVEDSAAHPAASF